MMAALVLINLAALAWALAPLWRTTPLERRARALRRQPEDAGGPGGPAMVQGLAEDFAARAPARIRQRAAAMAEAAGLPATAAARVIIGSALLSLAALLLGGGVVLAVRPAQARRRLPQVIRRTDSIRAAGSAATAAAAIARTSYPRCKAIMAPAPAGAWASISARLRRTLPTRPSASATITGSTSANSSAAVPC